MPGWMLGLQLGIALLQTLQPEIEAAIVAAEKAGEDTAAHKGAMVAVADALGQFQAALAVALPKP
jgi:hypothetical protein